tara:strand:+ start:110 stop:415 length:306 start_codon:yes stop_codon:yes gene_type:complete
MLKPSDMLSKIGEFNHLDGFALSVDEFGDKYPLWLAKKVADNYGNGFWQSCDMVPYNKTRTILLKCFSRASEEGRLEIGNLSKKNKLGTFEEDYEGGIIYN